MGIFIAGRRSRKPRLPIFTSSVLTVLLALAGVFSFHTPAKAVTQTYSFSGGPQIYVVPEGVSTVSVIVDGAQGATPSGGGTGGSGARVSASISVNPGEVLMLMVGGNGSTNGGWNGGGRGAGTGGGASDIRRPAGAFNTSSSCAYSLSCGFAERLIVAGGGGGGGWAINSAATANGGAGGQTGTIGNTTNLGSGDATAGAGATQAAGGAGGTGSYTSSGSNAGSGSFGLGGSSAWVASATGGGGGGGYFGGGGGGVSQDAAVTPQADGAGGGGGGSSYAGGTGVSLAAFASGVRAGDGQIIVDPPSAIPSAAFGFTGSAQFYTVPQNTGEIFVRIYGGGSGATGDIVYGRLPVTSGQVLQVNIGGRGYGDTTFYPGHSTGEGGWNGGGQGYYSSGYGTGSGGGGSSDIRVCANPQVAACSLTDRVVVAGGGGGSSNGAWGLAGGRGGGGIAGAGADGSGGDFGGGATLAAGGAIRGTGIATAGALGIGGQSGQPFYGGGGGGGGLYGGGGGNGSGGGGGSSCAATSGACTSINNLIGAASSPFANTQGANGSSSDGMAVITAMPVAITGAVSAITSTTATISGSINAKFLASTPKLFLDTNQSTIESCSNINAPCTANNAVLRNTNLATVLAGESTQSVSGSITGLTANTTYYARVCAQSVAGYSCGATTSFSTQLSIVNNALPTSNVGVAVSDTLIGAGGSGTYTNWSLANSTSLPTGLALNTGTGVISGTPTVAGSGTFSIQVTDSLNATATKTINYTFNAPPPPSNSAANNQPVAQISGISPRTASSAGGTLITISGSNLSGVTVTIAGQPVNLITTSAQSFSFATPSGLLGPVDVVIIGPNVRITFQSAFTVVADKITPEQNRPAPDKYVLSLTNFAPGLATLTITHSSQLAKLKAKYSKFRTVTCTGFTMGPTVLKSDIALAKLRAANACSAIKTIWPKILVSKTSGRTELRTGSATRRVEIEFQN